jgi:hypothetical protein
LNENADKFEEMTLGEWLRRLNLPYLAPIFYTLRVVSLIDLKDFGDERALEENMIKLK